MSKMWFTYFFLLIARCLSHSPSTIGSSRPGVFPSRTLAVFACIVLLFISLSCFKIIYLTSVVGWFIDVRTVIQLMMFVVGVVQYTLPTIRAGSLGPHLRTNPPVEVGQWFSYQMDHFSGNRLWTADIQVKTFQRKKLSHCWMSSWSSHLTLSTECSL